MSDAGNIGWVSGASGTSHEGARTCRESEALSEVTALRTWNLLFTLGLVLLSSGVRAADLLLKNVNVYDGTGKPSRATDVRIHGTRIAAVAAGLKPIPGETVRDEHGLSLAPGFIDMHSHGDGGLLKDLDAATISRQGITTVFVGQDGESNYPLRDYYAGWHDDRNQRRAILRATTRRT